MTTTTTSKASPSSVPQVDISLRREENKLFVDLQKEGKVDTVSFDYLDASEAQMEAYAVLRTMKQLIKENSLNSLKVNLAVSGQTQKCLEQNLLWTEYKGNCEEVKIKTVEPEPQQLSQQPSTAPKFRVTLATDQSGVIGQANITGDGYEKSLKLDATFWTRLHTASNEEEQKAIFRQQLVNRLKRDAVEQLGQDFPDTTVKVDFFEPKVSLFNSSGSVLPSATDQELNGEMIGLLAPLPADIRQSPSTSELPQFDSLLEKSAWQHQEKAVKQTQNWVSTVKDKIAEGVEAGKSWFDALKQGLKSYVSRNLLQEMKDCISQRTEQLGNTISKLPQKIATNALMEEVSAKFAKGLRYNGESPVKMGEYTVQKEGDRFTLSTPSQDKALVFEAKKGTLGQPQFELRGKDPSLNPSDVLKRIRNFSPEDSPSEARGIIKQAIKHQLDGLSPGTQVGQWTVRKHQGSPILDNGKGKLLSSEGLDKLDFSSLKGFERVLGKTLEQQSLKDHVKVLGQVLGIVKKSQVTDKKGTYQIDFKADAMTLRFESGGESFTAKSVGKGQWQLVDGELTPNLAQKIQQGLKPPVDAHLQQQKTQKQQLAQLANSL